MRRQPRGGQTGCDRIALVLQGGGALGAYQAGVYQALHEAGLEPDWIAGVSIGGINGAIIAGNPPERRLERLRQFWDTITARPTSLFVPDGDDPRRLANAWSSMLTMTLGQPAFLHAERSQSLDQPARLRHRDQLLRQRAVAQDAARAGRLRLPEQQRHALRLRCRQRRSGNFAYFDTAETTSRPQHVMASGALPPALPMMQIGTDWYWDGGLVSNTPLQHVFDNFGASPRWCSRSICSAPAARCRATCPKCWPARRTSSTPAARAW